MSPRDRTMAILREIANRHDVGLAELLGPTRYGELGHPRRVAWRFLRRRGFSTTQLGQLFGRDHTTIIYGMRARHVRENWASRPRSPQAVDRRGLRPAPEYGNKTSASGRAP